MTKTITVLSGLIRPLVETRLPGWVEPRFFTSKEEAIALAPEAEIGWFDMYDKKDMAAAITAATKMKWLNSIYAGVDGMPLDLLKERGTVVTNGAGINAITIAEYVVMGMLTVAKGYRDVVRAQERREWLIESPGKVELYGSKALLLGYGAIGKLIEERLKGFAVDVTVVRRSPPKETGGANTLTPDQWRARLGEFDWVILAVPATPETDGMIGAAELAAMKPTATLINIARGAVVDQDALVAALDAKQIASAFLDVTTPEPLPADDVLWSLDNAHITMHLSGRAQDKMFVRAAERFLDNLDRWHKGEPVEPRVDLTLGY
ncbi:MAG TPA: D-2-hydroxyacid dehydrogenase [Sphingopyxis sp.]|uniref:D-2-hydroxyacid dehydrogenase n=1 Tax=Sphingopyxis sp. TaxID=1908224 RepID=UPI002E303984|nr:D-2-hydroxyacid dehydrogenase [Sphingopyxis sp.]HEX2811313.1 D-2-hydroxyacid dehydrogenase [Sphingopyxis sp.]